MNSNIVQLSIFHEPWKNGYKFSWRNLGNKWKEIYQPAINVFTNYNDTSVERVKKPMLLSSLAS